MSDRGVGVEEAVAAAFRSDWGRIVATLIRTTGDWDLAEECAQDAFARALETWPDGAPDKPGAWLTTVARNRALDRLRRAGVEAAKLREVALLPAPEVPPADESGIADDRLRLLFTCCHPALPLEARVALTLRTLTGLTTAEIARALLTSEPTMAKRLVRAKHKIRAAGIPYRVPPSEALPERLDGVLAVVYLLFNEGYAASTGDVLVRRNLCDEAIRLASLLVRSMPHSETFGLAALLLLQHSRRAARVAVDGRLVTLDRQDRSQWDQEAIADGLALLARADGDGPYALQARIAAGHAVAPTADDTDWRRISELYATLLAVTGSPVVALNRAVAVGMADGPEAGLRLVEEIESSGNLTDYHLLPAVKGDLLECSGRADEARSSYERALGMATNELDRDHLRRRVAALGSADPLVVRRLRDV
ncbi:RNA polymerase sigma factor [Nocardioides sp. T2.26MG-1]|uniref:RNA polymerase sigma factor n=1 Tax=Nocardioides sp. T2.26MG-1 TaxID=3041166 RepID=UPI0031455803